MCGSATSLIWELQGITMQRDPHSWPKFADQMRDDVRFESAQFVELLFDIGSGITRETVMFCVCTHQKAPERQQIVRPDGIYLMKEAEEAVTMLKDGYKKRSLRGVMQATDVAIEFEKTDYAVMISNTSEAPLVWILNGAPRVLWIQSFNLQHDKEREAQMAVEEKFLAGVKKVILLGEKHFPKAWANKVKEMRPPEPICPACPKGKKQQTEKDESQTMAAQPSRRPRRNREEEATVEELNPDELFGEESEEGADADSDENGSFESGEGSSEDEDSSDSEDKKKKKKKKGKKGTETKKTESEEDDDTQQTAKKKSRRGAATQARVAKPQTGVRLSEGEDRLPHLRGNRNKTDNRREGMLRKNQTSLEVDSLRQLAKEEEEKEKKKKKKKRKEEGGDNKK
uniref:Uncharacterized protein n=1 Tax=Chromera velia CCMP2878 TaxID=1169474 RepID=A0A0G4HA10_9ALVE|eukprot:Cvel_25418.t1-p1 / transcript=Cvel_25418.t1 / gene=Cvel_25418 / organism=Chromera_velia_CCMP2878 / gene_product=hypothetical protein / transcript_product=hypothetical protein / location=Cvel_scaffold2877:20183-21782(+) / protein_length=398 / sequence_SO=supercontig / SO=protein_coding / is_pseudo=false